jgi:hypothetical protein
MFEKTSARGTQYFQGRIGLAKIVLLKSQETSASGEAIWELAIQEPAAPPAAQPAAKASAAAQALFQDPLPLRQGKASRPRLTGDPGPLANDPVDDLWRDGGQP